jgi:transcriptional regulator with XRE-family HTH domain
MSGRTRPAVDNRLSRLLFARGWSDRILAERAGIERSRINRLKNRQARPTVGDALRISAALGLPVASIFWLSEPDEAVRSSARRRAVFP